MKNKYDPKAARGALLQDKKDPGWAQGVDIDSLDMGDSCHCTLGQRHGRYKVGRKALGLNIFKAVKHGFNIPLFRRIFLDFLPPLSVNKEYKLLAEAWIPLIKERQENPHKFA